MENPEEILHSLEEFSKTKPKDIPRELEEYLCFVAKTGDPIYQWSAIKSLFREKMINVITEFYETCPSVEIPPCPNVDLFNYDVMKSFILEKLDTFAAAPFTLQRICELLTTPRKEYNRIDKYMRALEKNILVVSTTEPGGRRNAENGDGIMNGLESEHLPETSNSSNDINVEEMDDTPSWPRLFQNETTSSSFPSESAAAAEEVSAEATSKIVQDTVVTASKLPEVPCSSSQDSVITCTNTEEPYVSIEAVPSSNTCTKPDTPQEDSLPQEDVSVTITSIPAGVQKRRNSVEPVVSSDSADTVPESSDIDSFTKTAEEEPLQKETVQTDEEILSSTQDIKDADSSSNPDEDSLGSNDDKIPDTSSLPSDPSPQSELSSSSSEEETKQNLVETSDMLTENKEVVTESEAALLETNDETTVDTTKCSIDQQLYQEQKEDIDEITSTDKITEDIESSETITTNTAEAEAKIEEGEHEAEKITPLNEASSLSPEIKEDEISESQIVDDKLPISSEKVDIAETEDVTNDSTPMDVDDSSSNSDKSNEIVKAEATSDSLL